MEKPKIIILGNGNDWCELCLSDLSKYENTNIINSSLPCPQKGVKSKLVKWHYSQTLAHWINLPFKSIWYSYFADFISLDREREIVIVIYDRHRLANNKSFLDYLRAYFKKVKLVYIFTNVMRISGASSNNFIDQLQKYYDAILSFDKGDERRYGFKSIPLPYSENNVGLIEENSSVFFVGQAKDRLDTILSIFQRLTKIGESCEFYLTNVEEDKIRFEQDIIYNKRLKYQDVIKHVQQAGCILDVIQGNSEGFTLKVCEAVFYDKLLITTNKAVKSAPFYDPRFVLVVENAEDITKDFFLNRDKVKYSDDGKKYFSVESYLERILEAAGY